MKNENEIYRELLDYLADGVYFTDTERRIAFWNKSAEAISGYSREEIIGKRCMDNLLIHVDASGNEICTNGCPLNQTLQDGQVHEGNVFLHHKDGHRVPVRVRVVPLKSDTGAIIGAVEVFNDNSANLQTEQRLQQLEQLALLDTLTGLANRRYLESTLRSRLEEFCRNNWKFGVLFIDIDNFKHVNDSYGHEAGDKVLQMVGRTLSAGLRYFDVVGRWGGEEFLSVIANVGERELADIGERMRILVEHSMLSDPVSIAVTISIGGAMAAAEDTPESLVHRADEKLYQAKKSGKNRLCI
jgi:diguanylate cyclase (GGDEF)-like protein/PAS domain S-box-containing protein